MSGLSKELLQVAAQTRRPGPGDIAFIIRLNAVAPGNIPSIDKLITRCRIVREQTNGVRVVVLNSTTGLPEESVVGGAFIHRNTHAILSTREEALEQAAQMVGDVLDVLQVMRDHAESVLHELEGQAHGRF